MNTNTATNLVQFPFDRMGKKYTPHHRTTVDPIKSLDDIKRAKEYFLNLPNTYRSQNLRNYMLFMIGINFGRRIGDILKLKINNIIDKDNKQKEFIDIYEGKNKEWTRVYIIPEVYEAVMLYLRVARKGKYNLNDYLFISHKTKNRLTYQGAYYVIKKMSKELDLKGNFATHSLRKTTAYQIIKANENDPYIIGGVSKLILNHKSVKTTLRYCGYDDDEAKKLYMSLNSSK